MKTLIYPNQHGRRTCTHVRGGLCTTMNDYLHFLSMIYHDGMYNGKQIISAETVKEMQADQVKGAIIPSNNSDNYVAKGLGQSHNGIYGLGEWRELIDKRQVKLIRLVHRDGPVLIRG